VKADNQCIVKSALRILKRDACLTVSEAEAEGAGGSSNSHTPGASSAVAPARLGQTMRQRASIAFVMRLIAYAADSGYAETLRNSSTYD
jgi:hypothetical protein